MNSSRDKCECGADISSLSFVTETTFDSATVVGEDSKISRLASHLWVSRPRKLKDVDVHRCAPQVCTRLDPQEAWLCFIAGEATLRHKRDLCVSAPSCAIDWTERASQASRLCALDFRGFSAVDPHGSEGIQEAMDSSRCRPAVHDVLLPLVQAPNDGREQPPVDRAQPPRLASWRCYRLAAVLPRVSRAMCGLLPCEC